MQSFADYFSGVTPKIETFHPHYNDAIRHILSAHGKLFRPQLLLSVVEAYEPMLVESSFPVAAALEIFHTYSLIHDDLPCMDNSPLRRGLETLHTKYTEATATLIGDGFNTYAFELIAKAPLRADVRIDLVNILASNGGLNGMVLGQAIDLEFENRTLKLEEVEVLHKNKTAKLIAASLLMGAVIVGLEKELREDLYEFGLDLGLLFQVQDDILDIIQSAKEAGKPTSFDGDKNSFITLIGLEESMRYADNLAQKIESRFKKFEEPLQRALAELIEAYLYRHQK